MVAPIPPIPAPSPRPRRAAPAPKTEFKVHASDIVRGHQSIEIHEILEHKGHKLKLVIKSDAYKFQCTATVNVFHPGELKWNGLVSLHHDLMKTKEGLVYMPAAQRRDPDLEWFRDLFAEDRKELLARVRMIL